MVEQKESVLVSLASLKSGIPQLTTDDCKIIEGTLRALAPFDQATVELSEEKKSGSNVIPTLKMLHHSLQRHAFSVTTETAVNLVENLKRRPLETLCNQESLSVMTTLLDPRFKTMALLNSQKPMMQ